MAGGRQAWCPRCDELRNARPGTTCPVCGRQLLAVPELRPGQARPGRADRLVRRLRALAPAAGAAGVALLVLAVVASAFAAGRLTRTTPTSPAAAATTTVPEFLDEGPETGRRDFGWEARDSELTVELRSLTTGTGFSRLELHVDGLPQNREISALRGLRIRDAAGDDLLPGGKLDSVATVASRPGVGGGTDTEVVLDRPLDLRAVASLELGGLTVARGIAEELGGTLVDRELRRAARDNTDDGRWLATRRTCPGCRLRVACKGCATVRVTGSAYRRGWVLVAVEALGQVEQTAINPSRRRVTVTEGAGNAELPAWIDGSGATAIISVAADQLAAARFADPSDDEPLSFGIYLEAQAEQAVRGAWVIDQAGG